MFRTTVDKILKTLSKTITDLEVHAEVSHGKAVVLSEEIERKEMEVITHLEEAVRAQTIADNLRCLLED